MALKITLKPNERMIIGGAVVNNGGTRTDFTIENTVPLLRQKDIMSEKEANSPSRRLYFAIQLMYIDQHNVVAYHNAYWSIVQDIVKAAPSVLGLIDQISELILGNQYYQALKLAKTLIEYEQEVTRRVRKSSRSLQIN
ncbi:MAG: flagellar biosynthesis repressor FlbT [Desulfobacterales bacterium]|nr:MAG: flagellar biosynthesis repressor FlbT [Desulfobacterales bacterium]